MSASDPRRTNSAQKKGGHWKLTRGEERPDTEAPGEKTHSAVKGKLNSRRQRTPRLIGFFLWRIDVARDRNLIATKAVRAVASNSGISKKGIVNDAENLRCAIGAGR